MSPRSLLATLILVTIAFSGCMTGAKEDGGEASLTPKMTITALESTRDNFRFDASGTKSTNPIIKYAWNFGDGELREGASVEKKYALVDTAFNVSLVVTDSKGNKAATYQAIQVGGYSNQQPMVMIREAARWVKPNTELNFDSSLSEDHDQDVISRLWVFGPHVTDNITHETPYMARGNRSDLLFDRTGVYFMHCHPHPWMKLRVAVDPAASAPSNSTITIENFSYGMDNLSVPPGTTLTFVNQDPIPHTATLERFASGTIQGTGKTVKIAAPPEGKYQLWIFGDDRKGGVGYTAYGVQVGADAPTNTFTAVNNGGPLLQAGVNQAAHDLADFTHNASLSATLTFTAPQAPTVKLEVVPDTGTTALLSAQGSTSPISLTGIAPKGNYRFLVTVAAGAIQGYTLSATITYLADPGFGYETSATGGCGHHC